MKNAEYDHIAAIGEVRFAQIEIRSLIAIKQDARLLAAEKTRLAIAHAAALKATGFNVPCFIAGDRQHEATPEFQEICNQVFVSATGAARAVFEGAVP